MKAQWISLCSRLDFSVVLLDEGPPLKVRWKGTWQSQLEGW